MKGATVQFKLSIVKLSNIVLTVGVGTCPREGQAKLTAQASVAGGVLKHLHRE